MTYYNEFDRGAAEWLRELIKAGEIQDGEVDDRSITEVRADDVRGVTRAHFFAGIGGWDYALQLAGWPEDRPIWTASLPCQPFSNAGKQEGTNDHRHLWPVFRDLVEELRPSTILGEQVGSKLGRAWLATVFADLEALGYAVAGADIPACCVGAPHIRQRLYWVAHRDDWSEGLVGRGGATVVGGAPDIAQSGLGWSGSNGGMGHSQQLGAGRDTGAGTQAQGRFGVRAVGDDVGSSSAVGGIPDTQGERGGRDLAGRQQKERAADRGDSAWDDVVYVPCSDGKARPIKPGLEPLVDGVPPDLVRGGDSCVPDVAATKEARVMRLKGYGNAVNIEVAVTFVRSVIDVLQEQEGPG